MCFVSDALQGCAFRFRGSCTRTYQNDYILYRVVKTGQVNTIPLNRHFTINFKKYEGKIPDCLPVISLGKQMPTSKLFGLVLD